MAQGDGEKYCLIKFISTILEPFPLKIIWVKSSLSLLVLLVCQDLDWWIMSFTDDTVKESIINHSSLLIVVATVAYGMGVS